MGMKGSIAAPASPSPGIDKYEAEDAARTLTRAEDIKANPPLHKAAHRHMRKQISALKRASAAKPMPMAKRGR